MTRSVFRTTARLIPALALVLIVLVPIGVYLWQNYSTTFRSGELFLASTSNLEMQKESKSTDEKSPADDSSLRKSVATKVVTRTRSGLNIGNRGHSVFYEASFPEFPNSSRFFRKVNLLIGKKHSETVAEFTQVDWSLVWDEIREPSWANHEWTGHVSTDVVFCSDEAVSLLEHHWEFTGGAHGNPWFVSRNFVFENNDVRELQLTDLFQSGSNWDKHLASFCMSDLRRQGATFLLPPDEESTRASTTPQVLEADDLRTFALSSEALWIFFGPYHVGTYAEGNYSVKVPFSELESFIPSNSPAKLFH